MQRAAREAEEHKLLPLHEAPTGKNNQSMRVNKPFPHQEIKAIEEDLGYYLEDPEKYIRAFNLALWPYLEGYYAYPGADANSWLKDSGFGANYCLWR